MGRPSSASTHEAAVVLQPVAEGAAPDHVEAVAAQIVLQSAAALGDVLEQDDPVEARLADPGELGLPVRHLLDQAGEHAVAHRLAHRHLDLVPVRLQPQIEGIQVAGVADAEEAHTGSLGGSKRLRSPRRLAALT
jgi:hypothetical protein